MAKNVLDVLSPKQVPQYHVLANICVDRPNPCIDRTAWISDHTSPKLTSWVLTPVVSSLVLGLLLYPSASVSLAHILYTYYPLRRRSCVWIILQAASSRALSIALTWRLKYPIVPAETWQLYLFLSMGTRLWYLRWNVSRCSSKKKGGCQSEAA